MMLPLSPLQQTLVDRPPAASVFLEGPAGCGKTAVGVARLLRLREEGIPAGSILVLVPHRPLAEPYLQALRSQHPEDGQEAGEELDRPDSPILTIAGLAQRAVRRFWSAAAGPAGFTYPRQPPAFINHETAQYVMALVARPLLSQGYFETVAVSPGRLYSQILDNLNRAAGAGFPYTEISRRLKSAWNGEPAQLRAFDDLQECAIRFRQFCLAHNLLDFSLLLEVFASRLWPDPQVQDALAGEFHHLIADNLEEDVALTHDILAAWLPRFTSSLLIFDHDGGYRLLLGADPESAYSLKDRCQHAVLLDQSFIMGPETAALAALLENSNFSMTSAAASLLRESPDTQYAAPITESGTIPGPPLFTPHASGLTPQAFRFYPQMLDWATALVADLVHQGGISPVEIAVLAPGLGDALLFSLTERLEREDVPVRSFRPSHPLRDEPAVPCLLVLAALAHPAWFEGAPSAEVPTRFDLAYALVQAIEGMDLVRAQLLAEIVYRLRGGFPGLTSFEEIRPETQERITPSLGEGYQALWNWLAAYREGEGLELDEFWRRLLDEVLLQPGFRFHNSADARRSAENLVDSARNFRLAVTSPTPAAPTPRGRRAVPSSQDLVPEVGPLGYAFLQFIREGIAPAQYLRGWLQPQEEAVLITSASTFLLANRPVDVQIWLDTGSRSWGERLHQPLTHPYVLSRQWVEGRLWTDEDEIETANRALIRQVLGLARRGRRSIFTCASQLSERGYPQEGPLLRWLQV